MMNFCVKFSGRIQSEKGGTKMRKWKRKMSFLLVCILITQCIIPASAKDTGKGAADEALKQELASFVEQYPDGAFEWRVSQINVEKNQGSLQVDVVRKGGTRGEASVDFKAIDVSASYGKDYRIEVEESGVMTRVLEGNKDVKPLTELYGEDMEDVEDDTLQIGEEPGEQDSEEDLETEDTLEVTATNLSAAREAYTGKSSGRASWTVLEENSASHKLAQEMTEEAIKATGQAAEQMDGVSHTLSFRDGEYKKSFKVNIIGYNIAAREEQILLILYNPVNCEIGDAYTAYINIIDNEYDEEAVFEMKEDSITVDRANGTVSVTILRTSGVGLFASVGVGTSALTGQAGKDYESFREEVLFLQGVKERTIKIPLLSGEGATENAAFYVGLDGETATLNEDKKVTQVTLTGELPAGPSPTPDASKAGDAEALAKADPQAAVNALAARNADGDDMEDMTGQATWSDIRNTGVNTTAGTGWSAWKDVLTGMDLFTAAQVKISYSISGSRYYCINPSACDKKKEYTTSYEKKLEVRAGVNSIGSASIGSGDSGTRTGTITVNLNAADKDLGKSISFRTVAAGNNDYSSATITKVEIVYESYTYQIDNSGGNAVSFPTTTYLERIYRANGANVQGNQRYDNGLQIVMGNGVISASNSGVKNTTTQTVYRTSTDTITLNGVFSTNKNTGSRVQVNANTVSFKGFQLKQKNTTNTWSATIPAANVKFTKDFVNTYKGNYLQNGVFVLRPVFEPNETTVYLKNADSKKATYGNGFGATGSIKIKRLDTIEVNGLATSGNAVQSFNLYSTDTLNAASGTAIGNVTFNSAIGNVITFSPEKTYNYITMNYTTPEITVKADPRGSNTTKGAVVYSDPNNAANSKSGNYQKPMVIKPVNLFTNYLISSLPDQGYKTVWKDFTGDTNSDGILNETEQNQMSGYGLVRTPSYGNVLSYTARAPFSMIYYDFQVASANAKTGIIEGRVLLRDKGILDKKEIINYVNGATVNVGDIAMTTGPDYRGTYGYFGAESNTYASMESYLVNVTYEGSSLSQIHTVNNFTNYVLDSYGVIDVDFDSVKVLKKGDATKLNPLSLHNGDITYQIIIPTFSHNNAVAARKGILRFYRKDGSSIGSALEVSSTNGIFEFEFNPKTLNVPPGTTMTVQFEDNMGKRYYEHATGVIFGESLGLMSILSSFNFGGPEKAIQLVGTVSSAFNFGWDGEFDNSKYVTSSADGNEKILTFGFDLNKGTQSDQKDLYDSKKALEEKAKKAALEPFGSTKQQEALKNVDDANKTEGKVAATGYVNFAFSISLRMTKDIDKSSVNCGQWYFNALTLTVKAGGGVNVRGEYVTPIGIPVIIVFSADVTGSATMMVCERVDTAATKYYFSDLKNSAGTVDLFSFNMNSSTRAFDAAGEFNISPTITLSAGTGISGVLELLVGGSAAFSFNFYTLADKKHNGMVTLEAFIDLKILIFNKRFKFLTESYDLFGKSYDGARALSPENYLYETLGEFEVSERENLKSRSGWYPKGNGESRSLAENHGVEEFVLQEGVNPYPNAQLTRLADGKYLAVFVDDVPARTKENSTAIFYSIYENGIWTPPSIIDDNGRLCDDPNVFDLGDRGVLVTWSAADRVFGEDPDLLQVLNSRNIHSAFFNKTTKTFGPIQEVTKSTAEDFTGDNQPHIAYCPADSELGVTEQLIIYYTKSEYTPTGHEEGVAGDVVSPYSLMAYQKYDFTTNQWVHTYSAEEKAKLIAQGIDANVYDQAWYGQGFLDLAPAVRLEENLDEQGFWEEAPTVTELTGLTDPWIVECDSICYNGLGMFAYVLDYDGDQETTNDRDIFLQIYDFKDGKFTHTVMVTSNDVENSNIRLTRTSGDQTSATVLTWLSDGDIKALNLSNVVKHCLVKDTTGGGQDYYYIDKTNPADISGFEEEGEANGYKSGMYEPIKNIVTGERALVDEEDPDAAFLKSAIQDFDVKASDNYVYALWTQRDVTLKEDVEPGSIESLQVENQTIETQIYTARYDTNTGILTAPVKVTDESGVNYSNIGFDLNDRGQLTAMAVKTGTTVENGEEADYPTEDIGGRKLVSLGINPASVLKLEALELDDVVAGADNGGIITLKNDGLDTFEDLKLSIKDSAGNELYDPTGDGTGDRKLAPIHGGMTEEFGFGFKPEEGAKAFTFTVEVTDKNDDVLLQKTFTETISEFVSLEDFSVEQGVQRDSFLVKAKVTNTGNRRSDATWMEIGYEKDEQDTSVTKANIPSLGIGESAFIETAVAIDSGKAFVSKKESDGSLTANAVIYGSIRESRLTQEITREATRNQLAAMGAIKNIVLGSKLGLSLVVGDFTELSANVNMNNFTYENSKKSGNQFLMTTQEEKASALKVLWKSSDESVAKIHDGFIEALKPGKVTLTSYIMPKDSTVNGDGAGSSSIENNYLTLPNEAIMVKTATVTVDPRGMKSLKSAKVTYAGKQFYTGKALKVKMTVKVGSVVLTEGRDFTVTYSKNKKVGTGKFTITGKRAYAGTVSKSFKIVKAKVGAISDQSYTGKAIKPKPKVTVSGKQLKRKKDYTLSYLKNKKTGKATVRINGKGAYGGTVTKTFRIVPKKVNIKKIASRQAGKVSLSWKKAVGASGYQAAYATSKKGKYKKAKTTKKLQYILKLKSKRTYYVKVRAYVVIGKKKVYGKFGAPKAIRVR